MNLKKLIGMSFLLCSLSVVPMVYAEEPAAGGPGGSSEPGMEQPSHKHHGKMEQKIQEIYGQLNLTDEQKKQLEENKAKNREQMKATFEKMRSLRDSLNQELMKTELDMGKINAIQGQLKGLQTQMADNRLSSILEVRKILAPEQFAKFLALMEKHKHERGHGPKGSEGQGPEGQGPDGPDGPEEK